MLPAHGSPLWARQAKSHVSTVSEPFLNKQRDPDAVVVARPPKKDKGATGLPGACTQITGALLSTFLSATGGISLGATIFPAGTSSNFLTAGLYIGLLTGLVANTTTPLGSKLPVAVGGTLIPAIITLTSALTDPNQCGLTKDSPNTILMALSLATLALGIVTWLAGYLGVERIVKACPHTVLVGFLVYTGWTLFIGALQVGVPSFNMWVELGGDNSRPNATLGWVALAEGNAPWKWLPSVMLATVVFVLQRWLESVDSESGLRNVARYLLPCSSILLLVGFHVVLAFLDVTCEEARQNGYLFASDASPNAFSFTSVWTTRWSNQGNAVNWNALRTLPFFLAVIQTCAIGLLTLIEDIYCVVKACVDPNDVTINVNDEVKACGLQNIACAIVGALPTNVVFSYTSAVHSVGAAGRPFYALQAAGSVLIFVLSPFVIAVLPRALPTFLLFWIGLKLFVWGLWDMRPRLDNRTAAASTMTRAEALEDIRHSTADHMIARANNPLGSFGVYEYGCVVVMVAVGICTNSGIMLVLGIILTWGSTLLNVPLDHVVTTVSSHRERRSTAIRSKKANELLSLRPCASHTLVVSLAPCFLNFFNVKCLEEVVERFVQMQKSHSPVRVVVMDWIDVSGISFDGTRCLMEIANYSAHQSFILYLTNVSDVCIQSFELYSVPYVFQHPACPSSQAGVFFIFNTLRQDSLNDALIACEDAALKGDLARTLLCAEESALKEQVAHLLDHHLLDAASHHSSLVAALFHAAVGEERTFRPDYVQMFVDALVHNSFNECEVVHDELKSSAGALVWLIEGVAVSTTCAAQNEKKLQHADASKMRCALGPFRSNSFFCGLSCSELNMSGTRIQSMTDGTICVILSRDAYECLEPALALLVSMFAHRSWAVSSCSESVLEPALLESAITNSFRSQQQ